MKRILKFITLLGVLFALVLSACTEEPKVPSDQDAPPAASVSVTAKEPLVSIKDVAVATYDYASLFLITVNGESAEVLPSYVDASKVLAKAGMYTVTCTYEGQSAACEVAVVATVYALELSKEEMTLKASAVEGTDFKSFFTATRDGEIEAITEEMIDSTVKAEAGDYAFTVNYHGISKTLSVHVLPDHIAEVLLSDPHPEVPLSALADFDATSLFSLYMDGVAVEVTEDMLTLNGLRSAKVGDEVEVTLSYSGIAEAHGAVTVKVVADEELILSARNIVTYPNGASIDLTSLFTITRGGEEIPVTIDMIEGSIDYSKTGDNVITLRYGGKSATATVTVKLGVVIGYTKGDTVNVLVGTDKASYPFANDFDVIINGTRFVNISEACFDLSKVDFSKAGDCKATLSILYNDAPVPNQIPPVVNFQTFTAEIIYHVVSASYKLSLKEETVRVPKGTTFDPARNVDLSINRTGRDVPQTLVDVKANVTSISTYFELRSKIDPAVTMPQEVTLAIYVYGVEEEPIMVHFFVVMESEATVVAHDRIAFVGETVYARDLFTITMGGQEVPVSQQNIVGKVDTFHPGAYDVTLTYDGIVATAHVVVYPQDLVGTYRTFLKTIPVVEEDDSEGEDVGWGDYGEEYYSVEDSSAQVIAEGIPLGALTIRADGTIRFNGSDAASVTGVDENTMRIRFSSWEFTLICKDGILVLDPDNAQRMKFSDSCRPYLYFSDKDWEICEYLTVNYGSSHVLETDYSSVYSFDIARIKSRADEHEIWYGLYVNILSHLTSNFDYEVKWGEVVFDEAYDPAQNASNAFTFGGEHYAFTVTGEGLGKIDRTSAADPYIGHTFNGTVDGKKATLRATSSGYDYYVDGRSVLSVRQNDVMNMKHGGLLKDGTLLFYAASSEQYGAYSYHFAPNLEDDTFTLLDRDPYFGVYDRGTMRFFFDGYGSGSFYENTSGTGSSASTDLTYVVRGGEAEVTFLSTDPKYTYGKKANFYVSNTLNVLTVKTSEGDLLSGEPFENTCITDGAIIRRSAYTIKGVSNAKTDFLKTITIVTKDGELSEEDKKSMVDLTSVGFQTSGFYDFTITVQVDGESVVTHHAVQVIFKDTTLPSDLLGVYSRGAIHEEGFNLRLDEFAQATVQIGLTPFTGFFSLSEDKSTFYAKMYSAEGDYLFMKGMVLQSGILRVDCSGAVNYVDYMVKTGGTMQAAGCSETVIRKLTSGSNTVYVVCKDAFTVGEVVTLTQSGSEYTIAYADGSTRRATIKWGNDPTAGLTFLD